MLRPLALSIAALVVTPLALNAAVTINLTGLALLNDAGGTPLPVDRPLFLVADTGGTGFGGVFAGTYRVGDTVDGLDDKVVSIFDFAVGAANFSSPGAAQHTVTLDETQFGGSGISLAVYWFDTPHVGTDLGDPNIEVSLAAGTDGNVYDPSLRGEGDMGAIDGSAPWVIPNQGATVGLNFLTASTGAGTQPNAAGNSLVGFVGVPEPSSLLSLALGCLLLFRRRR